MLTACGGGGGGSAGTTGEASTGVGLSAIAAANSLTGTPPTGGGTAPSTAAPGAPEQNDIVDASGNVVPAAYRSMAAQLSSATGMAYRYGAPGTTASVSTWPTSNINSLVSSKYPGARFQVGGPVDARYDDYSTNVAQAAFVADDPAKHIGVASLETLAMRENTFTQSPGLSWTYGSAPGGGLNDVNAMAYGASLPTALGRCYGRVTWCVTSIMAFQNGLLGTAGSNTADPRNTAQLEAGHVPTAVAITNGGEFALVTVWDTANVRGRIAVVALSERGTTNWKGGVYPGLPNYGNVGFMKIVGYVDLPDMKAPTDISVSTGLDSETMHRLYTAVGQSNFFISDDVDLKGNTSLWQTFQEGGVNDDSFARGGIAVVTSKSERKATFIDLKPLFAHYRNTYFGSRSSFDAAVNNTGMAPNQWPQAFSVVPSQTPAVISTVTLPSKPTAVKASLYGPQRAWIATEDGGLNFYNVGGYLNGGSASPSTIAATGRVAVGRNPTHIAYDKHGLERGVIVVSRGERKIDWVKFNDSNNGGSIVRTLSDSRLIDPVSAEDNDNHGTESFLLTVADYNGKQIANYRYGPVTFHTNPGSACQPPNGCGMAGAFEFGGAFALPGRAFQVTGANVP